MGTRTLGKLGNHTVESMELLDWCTRVTDYLANTADLNGGSLTSNPNGAPPGPQKFTGSASFFGGGPEILPFALGIPTVRISRTPQQGASGLNNALAVLVKVPQGNTSFEWSQLNQMANYADAGQNVAFYAQAYKHGLGSTWGGTFEAQDFSGDATTILVGVEINCLFNGLDVGPHGSKGALTITYGDSSPNSLNPAGATTSIGNAIAVEAQGGINRFQALTCLYAGGCFTRSILDLTHVHDSPRAISMAGGSCLQFGSGTAGGPVATWYPGGYAPVFNGAIRVQIDGTDVWLPTTSNHP